MREMRHRHRRNFRVPVERSYGDAADARVAVPPDLERAGRSDLPAMTVRDAEREAAIRMVMRYAVHPFTCRGGGPQRKWVLVNGITHEFHGSDAFVGGWCKILTDPDEYLMSPEQSRHLFPTRDAVGSARVQGRRSAY